MIGLGLAVPQLAVRARFGSAPPPTAYLDTGSFTAAATKTSAVDNGLYDVLVRNGGAVEWKRVFAVGGSATVTGPSGGNVTRVQYYGPLTLTPKATGSYGPNLLYGVAWNSLGAQTAGNANAAMLRPAMSYSRSSAALLDTDSHQGWCQAGSVNYVTSATARIVRYTRDAARGGTDWQADGVVNASPFTGLPAGAAHMGAPAYRASNDRIYFTVSNYPTATKAWLACYKRSDLTLIAYWPLADGSPTITLDGPAIDDTSGKLYCTDYTSPGVMRVYDLNAIEALASGTSAESARLSDLSDSRIGAYYTQTEQSFYANGVIYTNGSPVSGGAKMVIMRSAASGKWLGELGYTIPTTTPNHTGWGNKGANSEGGQIGVMLGTGTTYAVDFHDVPADPTYALTGLTLTGNHGVIGPATAPAGDYSVMTVAKLTTLTNDATKGGKRSLWDIAANSGQHELQCETTGQATMRGGTTTTVSATGALVVNTLSTVGGSVGSSGTAVDLLTHSNNAGSGTVATGTVTAQAMPAGAIFGIAAHHQDGRPEGVLAVHYVFAAKLTGAQMEALRLDHTLLWDATDGLSAGQKTAAEGS